jgi:LemA protein
MQSTLLAALMALGLVLALVIVPVIIGVLIYNRLIALRVESSAAWADIDVQLKRRHDLIPGLVEVVKGYAAHERETLESVTAARTTALHASRSEPEARGMVESQLTGALGRLFALSEGYPQLRAAEPFQELQRALADVEHGIQQARRYYNAVVRDLNTKVQQFPSSLVARAARIEEREFFEIETLEERLSPEVSF